MSQLTELDESPEDEITLRILGQIHRAFDRDFPQLANTAPAEFKQTQFAQGVGDTVTDATGDFRRVVDGFSAAQQDTDPENELAQPSNFATEDPTVVETASGSGPLVKSALYVFSTLVIFAVIVWLLSRL